MKLLMRMVSVAFVSEENPLKTVKAFNDNEDGDDYSWIWNDQSEDENDLVASEYGICSPDDWQMQNIKSFALMDEDDDWDEAEYDYCLVDPDFVLADITDQLENDDDWYDKVVEDFNQRYDLSNEQMGLIRSLVFNTDSEIEFEDIEYLGDEDTFESCVVLEGEENGVLVPAGDYDEDALNASAVISIAYMVSEEDYSEMPPAEELDNLGVGDGMSMIRESCYLLIPAKE